MPLLLLLLLLLALPQNNCATSVMKAVRNNFVCWRMNAVLCGMLGFHGFNGVKVRRMRRVARYHVW